MGMTMTSQELDQLVSAKVKEPGNELLQHHKIKQSFLIGSIITCSAKSPDFAVLC